MNTQEKALIEIQSDLGTFEGFNFRNQCAIFARLTASDVVNWDHDLKGEAEFWPSGDCPEVSLVFGRQEVTGSELRDLDRLISELGEDSKENFLRIYYAVQVTGESLAGLSAEKIQDQNLDLFFGTSFIDLRSEAAHQLFELYYPEEYRIWEKSHCDGLIFDVDRFLNSASFYTDEITLGEEKVLLVAPH